MPAPPRDRCLRRVLPALAALLLTGLATSGARAGGSPTGACCVDETGGCCVTTAADCSAIGGAYQGDGTSCAACPIVGDPTGACCFGKGGCTETTASECMFSLVGIQFFPGQSCAETACPFTGDGACCFDDGTCAVTDDYECFISGGTFQAGQSCTCVFCPELGACCFVDGVCQFTDSIDCVETGGTFLGEEIFCGKDECPVLGACCLDGSSCTVVVEGDCLKSDGVFLAGTDCREATCDGACCFPDGACVVLGSDDCDASGGAFEGEGTSCRALGKACPVLPGACCFDDGDCLVLDEEDCALDGGSFEGFGTICKDTFCPVLIGACCVDGSCTDDLTEDACDALGGEFVGIETTCKDDPCIPVGACCLNASGVGPPCTILDAFGCAAADGVYVGDDTDCKSDPCPAFLGACCFDEEPCLDALAPECAIIGGSFIGVGIPCAQGPCPDPGDCCVFDEVEAFVSVGEANIEAVGDFDQDGRNDVVILGAQPGPVTLGPVPGFAQVFLNLGTGPDGWIGLEGLLPALAVGVAPSGIDAGDLDADGIDDFAVSNQGDDNVYVFLNDGLNPNGTWTGTFTGPIVVDLPAGSGPSAIAIADVAGDFRNDLIVALENAGTVVILENTGGTTLVGGFGGFQQVSSVPVGNDPTSLDPEDLDNDKDTDIVVAVTGDSAVVVISRTGSQYQASSQMSTGSEPVDVDVADIDGDGNMDIVTSNRGSSNLSLLSGSSGATLVGGGGFLPAVQLAVGSMPRSVRATDLNGDGRRDLACVATAPGLGPVVQVLTNLGSAPTLAGGMFQFSLPTSIPLGGAAPNYLVNTDLNGDGIDDLVTVNADTNPTGGSVTALVNEFVCPDVDCNSNGIPDGCETEPDPLAPAVGGAADHCAAAQLACPDVVYQDTTLGATNGGALAGCAGVLGLYDVHYRYRPSASGAALVTLVGSATPSIVSVHAGCPPTDANRVACAAPPGTDAVFFAQRNQDYRIVIAGVGASAGPFQMQIIGPSCAGSAIDLNENAVPDECECLADLNGDDTVDVFDVILVSAAIGRPCAGCPEDLDFNGIVDVQDLIVVYANLGRCRFPDAAGPNLTATPVGDDDGGRPPTTPILGPTPVP